MDAGAEGEMLVEGGSIHVEFVRVGESLRVAIARGPTEQHVGLPIAKSVLPAARFRTAVESVGLEIPHLSAALINKYVSDLRHLQLV
jgi:hypothetical protein